MTTSIDECGAREYYEQRITHCRQIIAVCERQSVWISRGRGCAFLIAAAFAYGGFVGSLVTPVAYVLAGAFFLGFIALIVLDEAKKEAAKIARLRSDISQIQLARLDRCWERIPEVTVEVPPQAQAVSHDLDLFGHASLFQFLCRAHTPRGKDLLRDWLVEPASAVQCRARNLASAQLAKMREYREELDLRARRLASSPAGPRAFVTWAEGESWIDQRRWLIWTVRLLTLAFFLGLGCGITGLLHVDIAFVFCAAVCGVNMIVSVLFTGQVHDIFDRVDSRHNDISYYQQLLEMFDELPEEPELLNRLRESLGSSVAAPRQALRSLARIMKVAQMRHSAVFGILHIFVQIMTLIDFHVLTFLEAWQKKHSREPRTWFDAIGQLEALASLGSLVHDQPAWTFAIIDQQASKLKANQLGHPLLANSVCNDVEIGPQGTFLLVTGSNMSGKSTYLRSVGLNVVLAQAGGPVHATSCSLPPLQVATSMRIQDSLEDGVSFFMAELQRLKEIVDQAAELQFDNHRSFLFLLDEILQGTNSVERHIAVEHVVKHLTNCRALGAISTHDISLAQSPELMPICRTVHFRETLPPEGGMTFDYRIRDGVAASTNALKLLELVGLSVAKPVEQQVPSDKQP